MNENKKLMSGLKSKLVAAMCMLLVAVIMVVSSTYAWFTLSTAPEVTGITTNVGANGALEMLLVSTDENGKIIEKQSGVLVTGDAKSTNVEWGNLVDVSDPSYGLGQIMLLPSKLNAEDNALKAAILQIPQYGADGRVSTLAPNAYAGTYNNTAFYINNQLGVRAVGAASGLSERQIAYRNARSDAATKTGSALTEIAKSLQLNGSKLASIAIKFSLNDDAVLLAEDKAKLAVMVAHLERAVAIITEAYEYEFIAIAASNAVGESTESDLYYSNVQTMFDQNKTLSEVLATVKGYFAAESIPTAVTEIESAINKLNTTISNIAAANDAIDKLKTSEDEGGSSSVTDVKTALSYLLDTDSMKFCTYPIRELAQDKNEAISKIMPHISNLTLDITSGGGAYADIADHCGKYEAEITLEQGTAVMGYEVGGMPITMKVTPNPSVVPAPYLSAISGLVQLLGAPESKSQSGDQPISEFYGYIIDLGFKTNASGSDLLLQTNPADRIYDDNKNPETQGSGSNMTFAPVSGSQLSDSQVKKLMECFRIVFFTPDTQSDNTGTILQYAKLDMAEANLTYDINGWTANIILTDAAGNPLGEADGEGNFTPETMITSLTQNKAEYVSVLVYLDGEAITNADVAATTAASITGKMNLQFASSAELKPAENGGLHQTDSNTGS